MHPSPIGKKEGEYHTSSGVVIDPSPPPTGDTQIDLKDLDDALPTSAKNPIEAADLITQPRAILPGPLPTLAPKVSSAREASAREVSAREVREKICQAMTRSSVKCPWDLSVASLPYLKSHEIVLRKEKLFEELLDRIPDFYITLKDREKVHLPAYCKVFNNYAIRPDADHLVKKETDTITYKALGKIREVDAKQACLIKGKIYPNELTAIQCDVVETRKLEKGGICWALADGCNWGPKPQCAARTAATKAVEHISSYTTFKTTRAIAQAHLEALDAAQKAIIEMGDTATSATLTIATVVGKHLVVTSVGDAKVFVIRKEKDTFHCIDVTFGSRAASINARDCGGSLGGTITVGKEFREDLRNLAIHTLTLHPNDVVITCSDGIHDNFDPEFLGLLPNELGFGSTHWTNSDFMLALRRRALEQCVLQVVDPSKGYGDIADALFEYIDRLTLPLKIKILEVKGKVENNPKEFPGKPDHASVIVYKA